MVMWSKRNLSINVPVICLIRMNVLSAKMENGGVLINTGQLNLGDSRPSVLGLRYRKGRDKMFELVVFAVTYMVIFSCLALFHIVTRLDELIDLLSESENKE